MIAADRDLLASVIQGNLDGVTILCERDKRPAMAVVRSDEQSRELVYR